MIVFSADKRMHLDYWHFIQLFKHGDLAADQDGK